MNRPPRRTILQSMAAGSLAATAGCLDDVLATGPDSASRRLETSRSLDDSDSLTDAQLTDRIERTTSTYGSDGFWGRAETEPAHDLEFRRGWRMDSVDSADVDDEHLLALYAFPDEEFLGDSLFSLWFWSGVRESSDGRIEQLTTGIDLDTENARMADFSPKGLYETTDGNEMIQVGFDTRESIPNIDGAPQIERSVAWADVAYDAEASSMGWGGSFTVDYASEPTETRAMTAACLVAAESQSAIDATWHATVERES